MRPIVLLTLACTGCFHEPDPAAEDDDGASISSGVGAEQDESTSQDIDPQTDSSSDDATSQTDGAESVASSESGSTTSHESPTPMVHYPFDGDVQDVASEYHGVLVGDAMFTDSGIGQAILLDSDAYVDISSAAERVRSSLASLSLRVHVSLTEEQIVGTRVLLSLGASGEDIATNTFRVDVRDGALHLLTESDEGVDSLLDLQTALVADVWNDIVLVFFEDNVVVYLDGNITYDGPYVPAQTESTQLWLGSSWSGGALQAMLDDVQIFDVALSDADVARL